jgi:hypothetical protein
MPNGDRYGGYSLQRGDRDSSNRYEGAVRSAAAGDPLPLPGATPFVEQLQRDLSALGFALVGSADGIFGRQTEWAVREFQIYAKMDNIAQQTSVGVFARYLDSLAQVPNTSKYPGNVSGVVNADTRDSIEHWLANDWRCPVVVEAWNAPFAPPPPNILAENIWLKDEVNNTAPRMFVTDFTDYYTFPPGRSSSDIVLGDYSSSGQGGPRSVPPGHTWTEAEILPERLIGLPLASLLTGQRSTFKAIRAVSEVECEGFFDGLNAWDNATVSFGPYHWTLRIGSDLGEIPAFLAYLRHMNAAAFQEAIGFFGIDIDGNWVSAAGNADGADLFSNSQRKYTRSAWIEFQQDDGSFAPVPRTKEDTDYFRTWHWFYRFVMANRTIEPFFRLEWDMARMRIRDFLAVEWPSALGVPPVPVPEGGTRPATIGDVYTSEKAVALLLRWHVRFPAHICSMAQPGTQLRNAFGRANIPAAAGDPSAWTDANEQSLINGIMQEVAALGNAGFSSTMQSVRDWPRWAGGANPRRFALDPAIGNLDVARDSFEFDSSGLPLAPF